MQRETRGGGGPVAPAPDKGAAGGKVTTPGEAVGFPSTPYSAVCRLVIDGELRAFRIRNPWRTSAGARREFVSRRFEGQPVICRPGETRWRAAWTRSRGTRPPRSPPSRRG